jgi:hypothetical protein
VGFVTEGGKSGSYRAVMTLLALTTGAPRAAPVLFARLAQRDGSGMTSLSDCAQDLQGFVNERECRAIRGALQEYSRAAGSEQGGSLADWQARVGRFTFRLGPS